MLPGIVKNGLKLLRTVDQQLQQAVDIVHPGRTHTQPLSKPKPLPFTRRQLFTATVIATVPSLLNHSAPASAAESLASRINDDFSNIFQPSYLAPWDDKLIYYPRWMFGEWQVEMKFMNISTPLGPSFVPPGYLQPALASSEDGGIGSTYNFELRFFSTLPPTFQNNLNFNLGLPVNDAIIADRAFNTRSTTDAFLGYKGAVSQVDYNPTDAPLKEVVTLGSVGPDMSPLPPRRLDLTINALKSQTSKDEKTFWTSELARQASVAVRDVQVADYEVLHEYTLVKKNVVTGKQRSCLYLHPQQDLYFKAANRAVAVYDYEFTMRRKKVPSDAPAGAVACVMTPKNVIQCI